MIQGYFWVSKTRFFEVDGFQLEKLQGVLEKLEGEAHRRKFSSVVRTCEWFVSFQLLNYNAIFM